MFCILFYFISVNINFMIVFMVIVLVNYNNPGSIQNYA